MAVLVPLSDDNEVAPGRIYLEQGFGRADGPSDPIFEDLQAAKTWIEKRLRRR